MKTGISLLISLLGMAAIAASQDLEKLKSQSPVSFSGSINAGASLYQVRGIDNRQKPFSWQYSGQLSLGLYGIALPFTFTVSEKERSFRQPFNQFGLSPSYRWATAHGGYRSLSFSPLVFSGQSILCWGLELNPWRLRTGFVQGQFQRAVAEDTLASQTQTPAFRRTGYAAKFGFGSQDNYTDLTLLKAKDEAGSLPAPPVKTLLLPGENVAFGLSSHYRMLGFLSLDIEAGYSAYTRDQNAPETSLPGGIGPKLAAKFIVPKTSTKLARALELALGCRWTSLELAAEFKQIDPEYATMGIAYLADDVRSWGGRISWMPRGTVRTSANFSRQRDNLGSAKKATSHKTGLQLLLNYDSGLVAADLSYSLARSSQTAGAAPLNDSTKLAQSFHTIGLAPRIVLAANNGSHIIAGNYLYQFLKDDNAFTRGLSQWHGTVAGLTYTRTAGQASLSLGTTLSAMNTSSAHSRTLSFAPSASLSFWERRLTLSGNTSYSQSYNGRSLTGRTINSGLNSQFRPYQSHVISLGMNFTRFLACTSGQTSFSELKGELSYALSF